MSKNILVVGASGYIASRLIPELLAAGHQVRCLARSPQKLTRRPWFDEVDVVQADVTIEGSLRSVLKGQEIVYYLVHSMSAGEEYHALDLLSARNLSDAAAAAGVKKLIYLGGLADREDQKLAQHLSSRIQTGDALRKSGLPVIEFRSGVIIGAGSVSFEMIRALADQFPVLIGPVWLRHKTQPVSTRDVIARLVDAIDVADGVSLTVDLGCDEVFTYIDIMMAYARSRGSKPLNILLPFIPPRLMAFMISLLTPVSFQYALPLVQGLKNDSLVQYPVPMEHFPNHQYHPYHHSLEIALEETTLTTVGKTWLDSGAPETLGLFSGLAVHYRQIPSASVMSLENMAMEWISGTLGSSWVMAEEKLISDQTFEVEYQHPIYGRLWVKTENLPGKKAIIERTIALRPKGLAGYLIYYWYRFSRWSIKK